MIIAGCQSVPLKNSTAGSAVPGAPLPPPLTSVSVVGSAATAAVGGCVAGIEMIKAKVASAAMRMDRRDKRRCMVSFLVSPMLEIPPGAINSPMDTGCILFGMNTAGTDWRPLLRDARATVGMTRDDLAARSGVAAVTIKAYELGHRNPSRPLLTALLTALGVDRFLRNQILEGAGFIPDGLEVWLRNPDFALSLDEAVREISACRWPAIVTGEGLKLIAANDPYDRLWGQTGSRRGTMPAGDSFLSWLSYPPVADRLKNWDEVMSFLIGELKGSLRFPEEVPEGTSTYVKAALDRFFAGDAAYIGRYLALWDRVPPTKAKARFSYRIVMDHPRRGLLTFRCLGMGINEVDGLVLNDWVPEDADTWARLEEGGVVTPIDDDDRAVRALPLHRRKV